LYAVLDQLGVGRVVLVPAARLDDVDEAHRSTFRLSRPR
jgi:hypothetical protein